MTAVINETLKLMKAHVSVRNFRPDPVSDEAINAILEAALRAPTSSNLQAYSVIVVRDKAVKAQLAELAGNQDHIAEAPVFFVFCADLSHLDKACQMHGKTLAGDHLEALLMSTIDASLVGMCAALAAESLGLGTVMIGGVRNEPLKICALLNLPRQCFAVFGLCIGQPAQIPTQKPRLPKPAVIHQERYNNSPVEPWLAQYDEQLGRYYRTQGKPAHDAYWTKRVAETFSHGHRVRLREQLRILSFSAN